MSATEWHICPMCKLKIEKKKAEHKKELVEAYGKKTVKEYVELQEKHKEELIELQPEEDYDEQCTVREDSEASLQDDGTLWFIHKFHCEQCGTTWEDERTIKPKEE